MAFWKSEGSMAGFSRNAVFIGLESTRVQRRSMGSVRATGHDGLVLVVLLQ